MRVVSQELLDPVPFEEEVANGSDRHHIAADRLLEQRRDLTEYLAPREPCVLVPVDPDGRLALEQEPEALRWRALTQQQLVGLRSERQELGRDRVELMRRQLREQMRRP